MALSIIEHIYHSYKPYDSIVDRGRRRQPAYGRPRSRPRSWRPGLMVYSFGASLYYANATRFTAEVMDLVEEAEASAEHVRDLRLGHRRHRLLGRRHDATGAGGAGTKGVTLALVDLNPHVRNQLDEYGLTEKIGAGNISRLHRRRRQGSCGAATGGGRAGAIGDERSISDALVSLVAANAFATDARRPPPGGRRCARTVAARRPGGVEAGRRSRRPRRRCSRSRRRPGFPSSSRSATAGWRSRRSRSTAVARCRWPPTSLRPRTAGSSSRCAATPTSPTSGLFASPERDLVFDINDFDETLHGPFEWDLKRLAASLVVAGAVAWLRPACQSARRAQGCPGVPRPDGPLRRRCGRSTSTTTRSPCRRSSISSTSGRVR